MRNLYSLLNAHARDLCSGIDFDSDIRPYLEMTRLFWSGDVRSNPEFQGIYRNYWALNAARLGPEFLKGYFDCLESLKSEEEPELKSIVHRLYDLPTNRTGRRTVQFSFASKLLHMLRPNTPVYDSMVEAFYFLPFGNANEEVESRLSRLLESHSFLVREYNRILQEGLLSDAIRVFRSSFAVDKHYSDAKVIDTLIWKFVPFIRAGLVAARVIYA